MRDVTHILDRAERRDPKPASPAFAKLNIKDSQTTSEIAQELDEARAALCKLATASEHPKP